ncbi:MAG: bifunctional precorrin-2 dehydrogenase/sirohydrochlorin ferrochelatase [Candidatus Electrothrix sp. AR4]|nr:bifunctional precorrin-2 dehydrogenase/sirohydrochlorin ferrochelatase [Candidatus Electrothrix sp. AR4]
MILNPSLLSSVVYPVCINITGKRCVVVGGGNVAERKVLSLLDAGASVRIISPQLTATLAGLTADAVGDHSACRIEWLERGYRQGDLAGALLVFAATNNKDVQNAIVQDANQADLLVNVADAPDHCGFQVPALVRRGDLTIAVSTNGKSPAVAAKVRQRLEKSYGEEYAVLLRLMSQLREQVCASSLNYTDRKILFQKILHEDIIQWIKTEQWDLLHKHLCTVLESDIIFDISQLTRNK